ncbi:MAG TPA: hypothetical protein VNG53_06370 [Bacteroidia bacterium]|nr:hypothetical protein [Bacteroidia bacterium]
MACTITVTSAVVNGGNLIVAGNFSATPSCTGTLTISVTITCLDAGGTVTCTGSGAVLLGTTLWQGSVPCACICGANNVTITATATCTSPSFTCTSVPLTLTTLCCCPSSTTAIIYGSCSNNAQLVTFNTIVSIPDACTFTFRRNFGDGNFGGNNTFTGPGTFNYPVEQHNYNAPNTYTSSLDVLPPPYGCGTIETINVSVSCAGCFSSVSLAALCRFLEFLFLLSMTLALGIGYSQPCISLGVAAVWFGIGLLALVVYLLLQCNKCVCDFFLKYFGEIFIAVGFVNLMYIPMQCNAVFGFPAFINALIFFTLGFLILYLWYNNNKLTCPLLICDFWCAAGGTLNMTSATNIAIFATILIDIFSVGALTAGLVVALLVITAFAAWVAMFPLSNLPCKKNTSTCQ